MQKHNDYSYYIKEIFEATPKTVFAAVAVSFGTNGGDQLLQAAYRIAREWETLYENGIVKQPPTAAAKDAIASGEMRGFSSFGGV